MEQRQSYNESVRQHIADCFVGARVETGVLAAATYLLAGPTSTELFNVIGRIRIMQLFMEATVVLSNSACEVYFTFTSTTPAIAIQPLNGTPVGGVPLLAQGLRLVYIGGAVASLGVITATAGISDVLCASPSIVGTEGGVGTIGITTDSVSCTSGSVQFCLCYAPMSEGAYCTAIL